MNANDKENISAIKSRDVGVIRKLLEGDVENAEKLEHKAHVRVVTVSWLSLIGLTCGLLVFDLCGVKNEAVHAAFVAPLVFGGLWRSYDWARNGSIRQKLYYYEILNDEQLNSMLDMCQQSEAANKYRADVVSCGRNFRWFDLIVIEELLGEETSEKMKARLERDSFLLIKSENK
jgi:hypothetical protein